MQIAEVVHAQTKFRRDVRGGTQLDDDHRTAQARAGAKRVPVVNRHRSFPASNQRASIRYWRWLSGLTRDSLRLGSGFAGDSADADIHNFDGSARGRMSESPAMRRMEVGDELVQEAYKKAESLIHEADRIINDARSRVTGS